MCHYVCVNTDLALSSTVGAFSVGEDQGICFGYSKISQQPYPLMIRIFEYPRLLEG